MWETTIRLGVHNKFTSAEIKRKNATFMFDDFKLIYCRPDNRVVSYYNAGFLLPKGQTINYTEISPAVFYYLSRHETFLPWITQGDLPTWLFLCAFLIFSLQFQPWYFLAHLYASRCIYTFYHLLSIWWQSTLLGRRASSETVRRMTSFVLIRLRLDE